MSWAVFAKASEIMNYFKNNLSPTRAAKIDNLDTAISSRAPSSTVNTINTNVGSDADASSPTGSVHAKLKDLKSVVYKGTYKSTVGRLPASIPTTKVPIVSLTGKGFVNDVRVIENSVHFRAEMVVDGIIHDISDGERAPLFAGRPLYSESATLQALIRETNIEFNSSFVLNVWSSFGNVSSTLGSFRISYYN